MLVYVLTIAAAIIVAVGEVVQQRMAAQAPPETNLSLRLLLWLVQQPRWLLGVAFSFAGNVILATALSMGSVTLVEAVFVARLLFALAIAVLWERQRLPNRDALGALAITIGLVVFLLAAEPVAGPLEVPPFRWIVGGGGIVLFAVVLAVIASRLGPIHKAVLLGTGAGALFGLQAALMKGAMHLLSTSGVLGLLASWRGYVVVAVAVLGMLLVQSAFEAAPLPASYPAVVTTELLAGVFVGVWLLGGTINLDALSLGLFLPALGLMIVGVYRLTTSPLVTGSHRPYQRSTAEGDPNQSDR